MNIGSGLLPSQKAKSIGQDCLAHYSGQALVYTW